MDVFVNADANAVRARAAAVETLRVHRQQAGAFMLKHSRIFLRKKTRGARHLRWLQEQTFAHPAHQIALQEMLEAVRTSRERVERLEATIEEFVERWSLAPIVRTLQALRGIDRGRELGMVHLANLFVSSDGCSAHVVVPVR